jgi:threonine dehydratase
MVDKNSDVTLEEIKLARSRIAGVAIRTPLEPSRWMSAELGREVFFKLECFQSTGSFKIRGAMAGMSSLNPDYGSRGVLTVSAGNHGLAVAHCAELLGLRATIVVPRAASRAKVEAIGRYPVTLIERGDNYDEAERAARLMELETGAAFISPYNDKEVIAGQGTVALEILEDAPDLDAIVVPCGGGGLIAGVLVAIKSINPRIKVYGAEPAASPTMRESIRAGRIVEIIEEETIADGLAGNIEPGSITFPITERLVDDILLVDESEIKNAVRRLAREDHIMIEGSAAVAVAALKSNQIDAGRVAAIVTGRNISLGLFRSLIAAD